MTQEIHEGSSAASECMFSSSTSPPNTLPKSRNESDSSLIIMDIMSMQPTAKNTAKSEKYIGSATSLGSALFPNVSCRNTLSPAYLSTKYIHAPNDIIASASVVLRSELAARKNGTNFTNSAAAAPAAEPEVSRGKNPSGGVPCPV